MNKQGTVTLPKKSFVGLFKALQNFAAFSDELEDYLLFSDPGFVKKIKGARAEHLKGKARSWENFRRRYV